MHVITISLLRYHFLMPPLTALILIPTTSIFLKPLLLMQDARLIHFLKIWLGQSQRVDESRYRPKYIISSIFRSLGSQSTYHIDPMFLTNRTVSLSFHVRCNQLKILKRPELNARASKELHLSNKVVLLGTRMSTKAAQPIKRELHTYQTACTSAFFAIDRL